MSTSTSIRPSIIIAATVGTLVTGFLAYALYFDHKRQTDPEFRKALKRESRREARVARTQAEVQGAQQKEAIKAAVEVAKEEGFPTDVEDKEAYFMNEVAKGETLCQDGTHFLEAQEFSYGTNSDAGSDHVEAAVCFYKALKVYPQPRDLISIYDKTVPKPVLDILAEMIATDPSIKVGASGSSTGGSQHGIDD
ncbi:hypothetical protein MMC13_003406 [Lambiella insularis]|nr:hypothetical protein [Lambiella insularis]